LRRLARCYKFGGNVSSESMRRSIQEAFPSLLVQTVDQAAVTSERLVEMLGEQTLEASRTGGPLAKKPEVDFLMRLAGTTQIARAIQEVGVKRGSDFLLLVFGDEAEIVKLESKEASHWERLARGQLDKDDLRRVERAALLDAERA
jgi:tRNA threonylcarbamoyladenosine modification (KEOPS) complex Cgi121 subunit